MKRKFISIILLSCVLVGCFNEDSADQPTSKQTNQANEQIPNKIYKVGDVVRVDGLEIQIVSAKYKKGVEHNGTKLSKVLILKVVASNLTPTTYVKHLSFQDFFLRDDSFGNTAERFYGEHYGMYQIQGPLDNGKKLSGILTYYVDGGKYYLIYDPYKSTHNNMVKFEIEPKGSQ